MSRAPHAPLVCLACIVHGWTLASASLLCAQTPVADAGVAVTASAEPIPSWVLPAALPEHAVTPSHGVELLLIDNQTRVEGAVVQRFYRRAVRPLSSVGLSAASEVTIRFDASYQRAAWHFIQIRRGGETLDALSNAELRRADADESPGENLVLGKTEITAFVRDVRVNDIVEFAYSVEGEPPLLGKHYADGFNVAQYSPVARFEQRLLFPHERTLLVRGYGTDLKPQRSQQGAYDVFVWRVEDSPAIEYEPNTPPSYDVAPWLQLSEFADWGEVVRWALRIYTSSAVEEPDLARLVESFRAAGTPIKAAERAVRFVQDEIRYLGFEFGEGSLRPRPPALVLKRRFGDCKDKALLLVYLLRALDIEAVPVLVSASDRDAVSRRLASPYAFDHVIVRARIAGRDIWIDATMSGQRGPLLERVAPPYVVALPLAPGVTQLEEIPQRPATEPDMLVREEFEIPDEKGPGQLKVTTSFRGARARQQRHTLATQTAQELQKTYLKFYNQKYKGVAVAAPLAFDDDEARDVVTIRESYSIAELWRDGGVYFDGWCVSQALVESDDEPDRKAPLSLPYPAYVRHEIRASLPISFPDSDETRPVERPEFNARYRTQHAGQLLELSYEYRSLQPSVLPSALPAYRSAIRQLRDNLGRQIHSGGGKTQVPELAGVGLMLGLVGILFVPRFLQAKVPEWRAHRRRRGFHAAARPDAGETAATALSIGSRESICEYMQRLRCTCAARSPLRATAEPSLSRYMGAEVWHQSASCPDCNTRTVRYFTLPATTA